MAMIADTTRGYSEAVRQAIVRQQQRYAYPQSTADVSGPQLQVLRQSFNVANEPVGLQMRAWSEYVGRTLDVPLSRTQVAKGFDGAIDTYVLKDMVYLDVRTDPLLQARTAARISTDNVRDFVFHVAVEGIVETTTGPSRREKATQFTPGILALDMGQSMHMVRPMRSHIMAFFLPRHIVESVIPDPESLHGRVIGYDTPLARLLPRHLAILRHELPTMTCEEMDSSLRTAAHLLMAAFGKQHRLGSRARAAARAAMQVQIKHYIEANLRRRELSPEAILGVFPLSRPTLYRMFEHEGGLFAYIRHCRLQEASDQLVRSPATPVAEVADSLGFGSSSDFSRAFLRTYGIAPSEFRAQGLDWLHQRCVDQQSAQVYFSRA
jgi:AraC-like DNA-binding protein